MGENWTKKKENFREIASGAKRGPKGEDDGTSRVHSGKYCKDKRGGQENLGRKGGRSSKKERPSIPVERLRDSGENTKRRGKSVGEWTLQKPGLCTREKKKTAGGKGRGRKRNSVTR